MKIQALVCYALLLWAPLQAQVILLENVQGIWMPTPSRIGQSFTLDSDAVVSGFSWLNGYAGSDLPDGAGYLYIFDQPFGGRANELAAATAGLIGRSDLYSDTQYRFTSGLSMLGSVRYYAYTDGVVFGRFSAQDRYAGGSSWSDFPNSTFVEYVGNDLDFRIYGTAIPEPSTYAALLGLAVVGFVAVRRSRRS